MILKQFYLKKYFELSHRNNQTSMLGKNIWSHLFANYIEINFLVIASHLVYPGRLLNSLFL